LSSIAGLLKEEGDVNAAKQLTRKVLPCVLLERYMADIRYTALPLDSLPGDAMITVNRFYLPPVNEEHGLCSQFVNKPINCMGP
jgi:hypothetical protein